eukprot:TRINITY_DN7878_c0_g1_i1.p1 TRINITY_DN7878_c0_g1~~TRINITY_DN7878_c0_g1_i1.p1  ORF type:complete len:801 (+),score=108.34 TRINITY_DN7878_c0_g1_i1:67-2469(+)
MSSSLSMQLVHRRYPSVSALNFRWLATVGNPVHTKQLLEPLVAKHVNISSIAAALKYIRSRDNTYCDRAVSELRFDVQYYRKGCDRYLRHVFFTGKKRIFNPDMAYLESVRERCVQTVVIQSNIDPSHRLFPRCFPHAHQIWNTSPLRHVFTEDPTLMPGSNHFDKALLAPDKDLPVVTLGDVLCDVLYKDVIAYCRAQYKSKIKSLPEGVAQINYQDPASFYPQARALKRKIVIHRGPTNSGKTYQAIEHMIKATRGIFLAPLRLLAWEQHEKLIAKGVAAELVTGQELVSCFNPTHMAATVEMADVDSRWDVAVIDECQNIGHPERGWAWTRALLGTQADTVYVIEDGSATELIKQLAASTGDEVEIVQHERLSPLTTATEVVNDLANIREGDCIVAFARQQLFTYKFKIEQATGLKCAVVYGGLPPDVRKQQAQLFNDPDSEYKVLVASDAIGMGLNFDIGRIIFSTLYKYDGHATRCLTAAEMRQIAGRAGRFQSRFKGAGEVTTMEPEQLPILREALRPDLDLPPMERAGLTFDPDVLTRFHISALLTDDTEAQSVARSLVSSLEYLSRRVEVGELFELSDMSELIRIAEDLDPIRRLPFDLKCVIANAPVKMEFTRIYLRRFAHMIADGRPIRLNLPGRHRPNYPVGPDPIRMRELECIHDVLDLYLWLGRRLGHAVLPQMNVVMEHRQATARAISDSLEQMVYRRLQGDEDLVQTNVRERDLVKQMNERNVLTIVGQERRHGRKQGEHQQGRHRFGDRRSKRKMDGDRHGGKGRKQKDERADKTKKRVKFRIF